jgi:micrococcal nuclease
MEVRMTSALTPLPLHRALPALALAAVLVASVPVSRTEPREPPANPATPQAQTLVRHVIPAELIRVIDGDTVEMRALIWLDQQVVTRVRLRGIDAPERDARCPEENRRAEAAAAALGALLAQRPLHLTDIGRDKYGGRIIARILVAGAGDAGAALLASGHARPYAGGRRERRCA